jgi:hypothetical protein
MTSIFRLIWTGFTPAATVENHTGRTESMALSGDERAAERLLDAFFDLSEAAA